MILNVYGKENGKKVVVKTYTVESYDLMWETVEDVAGLIDFDSLKEMSNVEILAAIVKIVKNNIGKFKELMKDIFEGLTDEELKKTKVKEIAKAIYDVALYTGSELLSGGSDEKN